MPSNHLGRNDMVHTIASALTLVIWILGIYAWAQYFTAVWHG